MKQIEINLLETLMDHDDSINEITNLWYNEQGPVAASKLKEANQLLLLGSKSGCDRAATILQDLITEYAIQETQWVEPLNQLAKLEYIRGNVKKAELLCIQVLQIKPWHHSAVACLVQIYIRQNDTTKAMYWSRYRLPSLQPIGTTNPRRIEWVEYAVQQASQQLTAYEQKLKDSFRSTDNEDSRASRIVIIKVDEDWQ